MARYIEADELAEHKFPYVTFERYVSDGKPKSEEEIYAYKVGYNDAIDGIVRFAPTADVRENVHAHWEKAYGDSRLMCSVCKSKEIVPTMMGKPIVWGFCPCCGAVMDERSEEE